MWQACPICKGEGLLPGKGPQSTYRVCRVCDGIGIISELTGKPPGRNSTQNLTQDGTDIQRRGS